VKRLQSHLFRYDSHDRSHFRCHCHWHDRWLMDEQGVDSIS
jgi:hypothetical protein